MERAKPIVTEADIDQAVSWFKEQTGEMPRFIALNPKNAALDAKVPEGIELRLIGGCLVWEVWLASGEPIPMVSGCGRFNTRRDNEIISAGGFWCEACLVAKPAVERSLDPRYCQGCYQFLLAEAELDTSRRGGEWKPVRPSESTAQVSHVVRRNMSPMAVKKTEVDIIHPADAIRTLRKRGPKPKYLPEKLITQLAGNGMGSKAIAARLKDEGIKVSYKTIQRFLSGKRQLALPIDAS
jgi:hypothetical protein